MSSIGNKSLPVIEIYNHQSAINIDDSLMSWLEKKSAAILPIVNDVAAFDFCALKSLEDIEVSLVDDERIAQIHIDFMDIFGATDVITFHHGEIIISIETAKRQAEEYAKTLEKELLLYVTHGLLHLAGYDDRTDKERTTMEGLQDQILLQVID